MKLANMSAAILPFCVLLMSVSPSKADDLRNAQRAVSALLKKNGGGLVAQSNLCPKRNNDEWEYVENSQIVPINGSSNAILIDSRWCNGGNKHGQYLVIAQNGSTRVVTNAEIDDMSFIGQISRVEGTSVFLTGYRWLPNDPHCCPSRKATLEYNIRTGQHKFTLSNEKGAVSPGYAISRARRRCPSSVWREFNKYLILKYLKLLPEVNPTSVN